MHPTIKTKEKKIKISALIDSGCTHTTIAADTVQRERLPTEKMKTTMEIYNSDGHETDMEKSKKSYPLIWKQEDIQNKSMQWYQA